VEEDIVHIFPLTTLLKKGELSSKGNNVGGGLYQGAVNPSVLKSLQSGAFNIKVSSSVMKAMPSFLRLEYQAAA
jgi:hypothetical protein